VLFFEKVAGGERIATDKLWVYDFRTNQRFTLRERPLKKEDLDDFGACYGVRGRRDKRKESERFRAFSYDDLIKRDKVNLDIFWLKDEGHIDPDSLPSPDEIAEEIVENLELALEKFRKVALSLGSAK
jgi:type I restriction enzyme M protein